MAMQRARASHVMCMVDGTKRAYAQFALLKVTMHISSIIRLRIIAIFVLLDTEHTSCTCTYPSAVEE